MIPSDLSQTSLSSALDGARVLYLDGRIHETALLVAQEVTAIFQFLVFNFLLSSVSLCSFPRKLVIN